MDCASVGCEAVAGQYAAGCERSPLPLVAVYDPECADEPVTSFDRRGRRYAPTPIRTSPRETPHLPISEHLAAGVRAGTPDREPAEAVAPPAQVVLAWNVRNGVGPIRGGIDHERVVKNPATANARLTDDRLARIAPLRDPRFAR